jgi:hypothetical protein
VLSSHPTLVLPSGLFPSDLTTKPSMRLSCLHTCYMPRPPHPLWFDYPNNIWSWVGSTYHELSTTLFSPSFHSFLHLSPTLLPQHHSFRKPLLWQTKFHFHVKGQVTSQFLNLHERWEILRSYLGANLPWGHSSFRFSTIIYTHYSSPRPPPLHKHASEPAAIIWSALAWCFHAAEN